MCVHRGACQDGATFDHVQQGSDGTAVRERWVAGRRLQEPRVDFRIPLGEVGILLVITAEAVRGGPAVRAESATALPVAGGVREGAEEELLHPLRCRDRFREQWAGEGCRGRR